MNTEILCKGLQASNLHVCLYDNSKAEEMQMRVDIDMLHKHLLVWHFNKEGDQTPKRRRSNDDSDIPCKKRKQKTAALYIKSLTGKIIPLNDDIEPSSTIGRVKLHLEQQEGVKAYAQRLIYGGMRLEDGRTLSDYNILKGTTLLLYIRQCGGGPGYALDEDILDNRFDFKYPTIENPGAKFSRGGSQFQRPCGWDKKAIKVVGLYENDDWLGVCGSNSRYESVGNEWPVSYHGTHKRFADDIGKYGYDITKGKRFRYGRGVYSTPSPKIAEQYATEFTHDNDKYKMILMNRVNMESTRVVEVRGAGKYFITSEETDIRPYAFLIKKC